MIDIGAPMHGHDIATNHSPPPIPPGTLTQQDRPHRSARDIDGGKAASVRPHRTDKSDNTGYDNRSETSQNRPTNRRQQISYFIQRAQDYSAALKNLEQNVVLIRDEVLGVGPLARPGPSDAAAGFTFYGSEINDLLAVRTRAIQQVSGGGGDDIFSLAAHSVGTVRGNSGDDMIAITAHEVEKVQGGIGDDLLAIMARRVGQVDGGSGDDLIAVAAREITTVSGGDGDDAIAITARNIGQVSGGAGDDSILAAGRQIGRVFGADGDDTMRIAGRTLGSVGGGSGDDAVSVIGRSVEFVNGGDGDDIVTVTARELHTVNGGAGDDIVNVTARNITTVSGDGELNQVDQYGDLYSDSQSGDDLIAVTARNVGLVHGGGGDDILSVNAKFADIINGGTGNDLIDLNVGTAMIRMGADAGQDIAQVQAAGHLTISFAGVDLADIDITRAGDTITLTSPTGASLHLTGVSNIRELSILAADSGDEPHLIHIADDAGLDLRM
jgi:hypothetical protein